MTSHDTVYCGTPTIRHLDQSHAADIGQLTETNQTLNIYVKSWKVQILYLVSKALEIGLYNCTKTEKTVLAKRHVKPRDSREKGL